MPVMRNAALGAARAPDQADRDARRARPFLSIVAILIAVFVLDADFHSTPRPILVVVTSAVAISVGTVIVGARSPISTYRTVVRVGIAFHPIPVARVGSPVATDSTVFTPITSLLTRLLLAALWLHGDCRVWLLFVSG